MIASVDGVDIHELPRDAACPEPPFEGDNVNEEYEKHFGATKPWVGNAQPPTWWDRQQLNTKAPNVTLELDFVYGYRSRQAHNNVHWIDAPTTFIYHAAAVCICTNIATRRQKFFLQHKDDVVSLAYCERTRTAASGGLGANATAPIYVWSVDDMSTKQHLSGTLQFAVVAVCFSFDGSRVFGIGDDNAHSVAMYDVGTGMLLASAPGDRNKLVHIISNTTAGNDSRRAMVTIGVSHVKFWEKIKGKEELQGKRAIGGDISKQTMVSACCTVQYVIVGNVGGGIYVFCDTQLLKTIQAHSPFVGALFAVYNTVYSGGRDGLLKQWNFERLDGVLEKTIDLNPHCALSATGASSLSGKKQQFNCPRAISVVDGKIVTGTQLGCLHFLPNEFECVTVLDTHFDSSPGELDELWGMDVHPKEPLFCTVSDDCTLRLWSVELGSMILMTHVSFPSRAVAFSNDGALICVGHENGAFSVWDSMTLTPVLPFTRKREAKVSDCSFSPDGRFLALSMGQSNVIDVYFVKRNFEFIGFCDGAVSQVKRIDWNQASTSIQCCSSSYEVVRFAIPSCTLHQGMEVHDEVWASQRCIIGWPVQGIWEGCNDGTDINSCGRSYSNRYLVTAYDSCKIRIFNYPCLVLSLESSTKAVFPEHREYKGHSSHVTEVQFTCDDRFVLSAGGADLTVLRWRVVPVVNRSGTTAPTSNPEGLAEAVANAKIHELGTSTKRIFVDEQRYRDATAASVNPVAGDAKATKAGTQPPLASTTQRRPFSGNAGVKSRLFERTASAQAKAELGSRQREHIEKEMANLRRFKSYV